MTHGTPEPQDAMDWEEPTTQALSVAPPVNAADVAQVETLPPGLALPGAGSRVVPDGRAERDFKATMPSKSTILTNTQSKKTYNGLWSGANKLKMQNFKVSATVAEMGLLHGLPETAFNTLHAQTKTYKVHKADSEKKKAKKRPREESESAESELDGDQDDTAPRHTGSSTLVAFPGGVVIPEKLNKRRPRSFTDMRASQILRHISEVMLSQLGRSDKGAVEVESMYVPSTNTLVLATNNLKAIEAFADDIKQDLVRDPVFAEAGNFLGDLIRAVAVHQEKLSYRDETSMAKLDAAINGKRDRKFGRGDDGDDARKLCKLIKDHVAAPAILTHTDVAAHLDSGQAGIFLMHTSGIHAEQQLLRALLASGLRAQRVIIRGARNPCFGCYLALKYAHEKLGVVGLNHGDEPGFTWNGSLASGAAIGAEALVRDCALDNLKVEEYHTWVTREIASYVTDGANGSVPVRSRKERREPFAEGLTDPYSREGLSAEGYGAASDSDDEDVNAPFLAEINSSIKSIRSARGIEPKPRKRRKLATKEDATTGEATTGDDAGLDDTSGEPISIDVPDDFVLGPAPEAKPRKTKARAKPRATKGSSGPTGSSKKK